MPAGQPQEVQFPFSIDLSRFISQIEQANQLVGSVTTAATQAQANVQAAFDGNTRSQTQSTQSTTQNTQATQANTTATTQNVQATTQQTTAETRRSAAIERATAAEASSRIRVTQATLAQAAAQQRLAQAQAAAAAATARVTALEAVQGTTAAELAVATTAAATAQTRLTVAETGAAAAAARLTQSQLAAAAATRQVAAAQTQAAGGTNVLAKGFGFLRTAANILPGLGISGLFLLMFEGIKAAADALGGFNEASKKFAVDGKIFQDELKNTSHSVYETQANFGALNERIRLAGDSFVQKEAILKDYNKEFGSTIGIAKNINELESILIEKAPAYIQVLGLKARAQAAANLAAKEQERQIQKQLDHEKYLADLRENYAGRKYDSDKKELAYLEKQLALNQQVVDLDNAQALATLNKIQAQAQNEAATISGKNGFTDKKTGDAALRAEKASLKKAQVERDKADKLALEQRKAYNDLLAKLINEESALQAKAIPDNRAAELAASDAHFKQIVAERQLEIKEAKITDEQRKQLQIEFNKFSIDATKAAAEARNDINKKYDAQELKLKEAALKAIAELGGSAQDEETNKIRQHYAEQLQVIKAGGQDTVEVIKQLNESEQREIDDVNIKFGGDRIKKQTDLAVAGIKVAEKYQGESIKVERAKQIAILEAQLTGAQAQLDLLQNNGKEKNSIEVLQATEAIKNIQQAIKNATGKAEKFSLFQSIFGGIGEADQAVLKSALATTVSSFKNVTDSIIAGYQQQIDAKQKLIDKDNEQVQTAQDNLDKQLELQKEGYANDVTNAQAALDAKQAQRDADIAQQEEIQKKQDAIRKADAIAQEAAILAQNVETGVDMVGAIAKTFKAHAGIPFVGIALGVGFAALLVSTFLSLKNVLGGATKKRATGGEIDGPSHAQGGIDVLVRGKNGQSRREEWEGGEYLINKHSRRKAGPIIDAINDGSFFNMHPESLEQMLAARGISLPTDRPQQMIHFVGQRDEAIRQAATGGGNPAIDNINQNVQFLADKKRGEVERWQDKDFDYEKRGNLITKTPRK